MDRSSVWLWNCFSWEIWVGFVLGKELNVTQTRSSNTLVIRSLCWQYSIRRDESSKSPYSNICSVSFKAVKLHNFYNLMFRHQIIFRNLTSNVLVTIKWRLEMQVRINFVVSWTYRVYCWDSFCTNKTTWTIEKFDEHVGSDVRAENRKKKAQIYKMKTKVILEEDIDMQHCLHMQESSVQTTR